MATLHHAMALGMIAVLAAAMGTQARADGACLNDRDNLAIKAAAIQQELMVAALTCRQTPLYNRFVIAYRTDLQRSDADLQRYFERRGEGVAGYHRYKTKLANNASLESLHDIEGYCARARATFSTASELESYSLEDLVDAVDPAAEIGRCPRHHLASRDAD